MGLITLEMLLARPGFAGVDRDEAEELIADASALVRSAARGQLDDVGPADVPAVVVPVVVSMVRRGIRNPLGHNQESLGDYTASGVATLYLTDEERKVIREGAGLSGAGSVGMTSELPLSRSELDIGL